MNSTNSSNFELPQNYSILINRLEQLALGLDSALGNFTLDRQEVEISVGSGAGASAAAAAAIAAGRDTDGLSAENILFGVGNPIAAGRAPPPRVSQHGLTDAEEYSRVVSDIWIGVILTLLIVSVIFFICACFLYHKFQQWKNTYRTNHSEAAEICRRFPADYEVESLPSYTIVSGLPSYDDALEEFRKAGIKLRPTMVPIIKIFEADTKEAQLYGHNSNSNNSAETTFSEQLQLQQPQSLLRRGSNDNISLSSTCTCGAVSINNNNNNNLNLNSALFAPTPTGTATTGFNVPINIGGPTLTPQLIELSPDHLAALSQKRLSLQIAFNSSIRRSSRPRLDLRNNLLRSRAASSTAGYAIPNGQLNDATLLPAIHRSSSVNSLVNERNLLDQRLQHLHHRGSLC